MEAFAKIANVLTTEPRCSNCHGGVNPYIDGIGLDPLDSSVPPSLIEHGGGKQVHEGARSPDNQPLADTGCSECHNHMALRTSDGSPSKWMTAPGFLSFVGKDAPTLCQQIRGSSGTRDGLLGHFNDDNGGNAFTETAFNGDRGLDRTLYSEREVPTEKPHISHEALMTLAVDWLDALGGEFQGDRECGCVPIQYSIRLTATTDFAGNGFSYRGTLKADIPITFADDGRFSGQGTGTFQGGGAIGTSCRAQVGGSVGLSASGRAIETAEQQSMQLQLNHTDATLSVTMICNGRTVSTAAASPLQAIPLLTLKGFVGEALDQDVPPGPTHVHLEIIRRSP